MLIDIESPSYRSGQCVIDPKQGKGGIWLSGMDFANDPATYSEHQIGAVLSAVDIDLAVDCTGLVVKKVPLSDSETQSLEGCFKSVYQFIDEQSAVTNVLVHCAAGISRGPALLISYIIKKYNHTFEQALERVRARRSQAFPNHYFQKQLRDYEKQLGL